MDATVANFRVLFAEFAEPVITDTQVQMYLDLATELQRCSSTAKLYLAAHMAALDKVDGVGDSETDVSETNTAGEGFGIQQKVGDLSVTYAVPDSGDAELLRTPYGRRAKQLMNAAKNRLVVGVYE